MGQPQTVPTTPPVRLGSLDAYRGLVMFLIIAELMKLVSVAKAVPGNPVWAFLAYHQSHVDWVGCSLHDLIQPSFSFLVGVAMPFSLANRAGRGQSQWAMILHAFWRAFVLVCLGVILTSLWGTRPEYVFTNTLAQIGLGYGFLFLIGFLPVRGQWAIFWAIVIGYWLAFALWPLSGSEFDRSTVGVTPEWHQQHGLTGFAAHWNKNTNAASAFDVWFLNLFPREKPFAFSTGGYQTLNFIPTLATMILGLIAGGVLRDDRSPRKKLMWLTSAGLTGLVVGYALGALGVCPVVKRIWTPSWVIFSGGWCLLLTAGFYAVIDVAGWRRWSFPLVIIGMNSIAAYCMSTSFIKPELHKLVKRHLGEGTFQVFGPEYATILHGMVTILLIWLILFWMYRRKVFIRV